MEGGLLIALAHTLQRATEPPFYSQEVWRSLRKSHLVSSPARFTLKLHPPGVSLRLARLLFL